MNFTKKESFLIVFSSSLLLLTFFITLVYGNIQSTLVEFELLPPRNYSIDLFVGGPTVDQTKNWSLISLPLKLINESYWSFLSSVESNWSILATYIDNGTTWYFDDPSGLFKDIDNVEIGKGYWIKMKNNDTIDFEGLNYNDSVKNRTITIPLTLGWNIIGYPYNYSQPLTTALSSIDGNWTEIWQFCNPACPVGIQNLTWIWTERDQAIDLFRLIKNLTPGVGYEIYINQSSNLVYNFTAT